MKSDPPPLFFIALLPDAALQAEITAFKRHCARHFGASHALKSPPHITLVSPFRWDSKRLPALKSALAGFARTQIPLNIGLRDFGCFAPRVLFVAVTPNPELDALAAALEHQLEQKIGLSRKAGHGFHPHMTIAHRDLQERIFPRAWAHFSALEFRRSFLADGLTLLRHSGGKWVVDADFPFL